MLSKNREKVKCVEEITMQISQHEKDITDRKFQTKIMNVDAKILTLSEINKSNTI